MLIFMKNAKKFLEKKSALSLIYYHQGYVYASNRHSLIWVEDASGREGAFDVTSNRLIENVTIPNYEKLLPPLSGNEPYSTVDVSALTEFLDILKATIACAIKQRDIKGVILLVWRQEGITAYARASRLRLDYRLSDRVENFSAVERTLFAAFDAQKMSDLVAYFRQRKAPVQFYALRSEHSSLRLEVASNVNADASAGGLLAPVRIIEREKWDDVLREFGAGGEL